MYEVEMKFRVPSPELFLRKLHDLGVEMEPEAEEYDRFYTHPVRDFTQTDECLRIRRRKDGRGAEEYSLTYKGPKIDTETKTRRELEIPLEETGSWDTLLEILGFHCVATVQKFRRRGEIGFGPRRFSVLLDRLPGLDDAVFVELETLAEEEKLAEAKETLLELARSMDLDESIRTSYLGLLTQRHAAR